jgi:hypothetical protein
MFQVIRVYALDDDGRMECIGGLIHDPHADRRLVWRPAPGQEWNARGLEWQRRIGQWMGEGKEPGGFMTYVVSRENGVGWAADLPIMLETMADVDLYLATG